MGTGGPSTVLSVVRGSFSCPQRHLPLRPLLVKAPVAVQGARHGLEPANGRTTRANTSRIGWCEASINRMRRVLRFRAAPTFSKRVTGT